MTHPLVRQLRFARVEFVRGLASGLSALICYLRPCAFTPQACAGERHGARQLPRRSGASPSHPPAWGKSAAGMLRHCGM